VAQGVGPEFKPQYHKKKKKIVPNSIRSLRRGQDRSKVPSVLSVSTETTRPIASGRGVLATAKGQWEGCWLSPVGLYSKKTCHITVGNRI
jgi:hypothetical protein